MDSLNVLISNYTKRLKGCDNIGDVRKAIEKDLYKKYGISRKAESLAYSIADYVADNLKIKH